MEALFRTPSLSRDQAPANSLGLHQFSKAMSYHLEELPSPARRGKVCPGGWSATTPAGNKTGLLQLDDLQSSATETEEASYGSALIAPPEIRRSIRSGVSQARGNWELMLKPIPVRIVGSEPSGIVFTEDAQAICIARRGARIILRHNLLPDDLVALKNQRNGIEEDFRVVGAVLPVSNARNEWGLEPLNPESEIWGELGARLMPTREYKIWIRCRGCKTVSLDGVLPIEHSVLLADGSTPRFCERCADRTMWKL